MEVRHLVFCLAISICVRLIIGLVVSLVKSLVRSSCAPLTALNIHLLRKDTCSQEPGTTQRSNKAGGPANCSSPAKMPASDQIEVLSLSGIYI